MKAEGESKRTEIVCVLGTVLMPLALRRGLPAGTRCLLSLQQQLLQVLRSYSASVLYRPQELARRACQGHWDPRAHQALAKHAWWPSQGSVWS